MVNSFILGGSTNAS